MSKSNNKVFIAGVTGYIGKAIAKSYLRNNWQVTGFCRDQSKALDLKKLGVNLVEGTIEDTNILGKVALDHDVIIHAAESRGTNEPIISSVKTLIEVGKINSKKNPCHFIWCSGCLVYGDTNLLNDEYTVCNNAIDFCKWKVNFELDTIGGENSKTTNFSTAYIRPGWVYGDYPGNLANSYLINCKKNSYVPIPKKLDNFISLVHVNDVADLFYSVGLKRGKGAFNSMENPITVKQFADSISKYLNIPQKEEVVKEFGFFSHCLSINQRIISTRDNEVGYSKKYNFVRDIDKIMSEVLTPKI